jgi:hypothetical protein
MATGGDGIEATVNHEVLGSKTYFFKSGEDHEDDPGGTRGEDDDNLVDGGGNNIKILKQVRWSKTLVISNDANGREDLKSLAAYAASPIDGDWTFSHLNGTTSKGKGAPVGDLKAAGSAATISFKIAGGGELKKIEG